MFALEKVNVFSYSDRITDTIATKNLQPILDQLSGQSWLHTTTASMYNWINYNYYLWMSCPPWLV